GEAAIVGRKTLHAIDQIPLQIEIKRASQSHKWSELLSPYCRHAFVRGSRAYKHERFREEFLIGNSSCLPSRGVKLDAMRLHSERQRNAIADRAISHLNTMYAARDMNPWFAIDADGCIQRYIIEFYTSDR